MIPILDKIHRESRTIPDFPKVGRTALFNMIKKFGFTYKKRSMEAEIFQLNDIVAQSFIMIILVCFSLMIVCQEQSFYNNP